MYILLLPSLDQSSSKENKNNNQEKKKKWKIKYIFCINKYLIHETKYSIYVGERQRTLGTDTWIFIHSIFIEKFPWKYMLFITLQLILSQPSKIRLRVERSCWKNIHFPLTGVHYTTLIFKDRYLFSNECCLRIILNYLSISFCFMSVREIYDINSLIQLKLKNKSILIKNSQQLQHNGTWYQIKKPFHVYFIPLLRQT